MIATNSLSEVKGCLELDHIIDACQHYFICVPALDHDVIYSTGAARGRGQTVTLVYQLDHLLFHQIIDVLYNPDELILTLLLA